MPIAPKSSPAQTVGRAIDLLKIVASSRSNQLRLVDLAQVAGLDKSTAHRLLQRLLEEGMLTRVPGQRGYRLGPLLYELGLTALPDRDIKGLCHPGLRRLADQTGDTSVLIMRSGYETVCVDRVAGNFAIQTLTTGIGDRHPIGVGAGSLALLSAMADSEISAILKCLAPQLEQYKLNEVSLRKRIALTRRRGYALDEGTAASGVTAIGHTIRLKNGAPVAAILIASISSRMTETRQGEISKRLAACIEEIETLMKRDSSNESAATIGGP